MADDINVCGSKVLYEMMSEVMMMRSFLTLFLVALLLSPAPALAQRVDQLPTPRQAPQPMAAQEPRAMVAPSALTNRIAATVNEAPITTSDLEARLKLALFSSGLQGSPDVIQKLLPRVLGSLIDEQLHLQEGAKYGLTASSNELEAALRRLAQENQVPGGDLRRLVSSNGIPVSTLEDQVRAGIVWNKVVMQQLRPRVDVGDDEIETIVQRLRANTGMTEYLVSEIFLAVDNPEDEESVRTLAAQLLEQLQSGAVFGAVANQFSQGLGAATGGDLGWIQEGQMAHEIDSQLPALSPGAITDPIRSTAGYHIIGLRDKRTIAISALDETKMMLQQAFRPFNANSRREDVLNEATAIRENIRGCANLEDEMARTYPLWRLHALGDVELATAPAWLSEKVANVQEGRATDAMATDKGAILLFVCKRNAPESIDREAIRVALGTEKMELMARRLQRDLRRAAHIDIKLK